MSVLHTWRDDLIKFSPSITYYIHHGGNKHDRRESFRLWRKSFEKTKRKFNTGKSSSDIHIVLTTYEIIFKDFQLFKNQNNSIYKWAYLVVKTKTLIKHQICYIVFFFSHKKIQFILPPFFRDFASYTYYSIYIF